MTEIFATGIQMGESPRWHDGRSKPASALDGTAQASESCRSARSIDFKRPRALLSVSSYSVAGTLSPHEMMVKLGKDLSLDKWEHLF